MKKAKTVYEEARLYILCDEQEQLCGYTEILIEELEDCHIDHFRKRDLFPKLTFDWENLIVSVNDDSFGAKYKDNGYRIKDVEYQLILNPAKDKTEDYFYFNQFGQIEPTNFSIRFSGAKKAEKTIEVFNLRDESLRMRREQIIRDINSYSGQLPKEELIKNLSCYGFKSVIEQYCV